VDSRIILKWIYEGVNRKFPDWPPGARTTNGIALLPLGAVVLLFCESV
jgi:hypothetical protein